jgi:hypothetical protein
MQPALKVLQVVSLINLWGGETAPQINEIKRNDSGLLKTAVSARASRGRKRLKSVMARDARHHTG